MECKVYKLNELKEYKYVVILSKYKEKILLSRHKERSTWETQGGHIEKGETPIEAAKRELFEESGAVKFSIIPLFDYRAGDDKLGSNGMVFMADITELADIPNSEMREVGSFVKLPNSLTYPEIIKTLFDNAEKFFEIHI